MLCPSFQFAPLKQHDLNPWPFWRQCVTSARCRGVRHAPGASRRWRLEVSHAAGWHVAARWVLGEDAGRLGHVLEAAAAVPGPAVGFAAGLRREVLGDVLRRVGGGGARGSWVEKNESKFSNWVPAAEQRVEMLNTNDGKVEKEHLDTKWIGKQRNAFKAAGRLSGRWLRCCRHGGVLVCGVKAWVLFGGVKALKQSEVLPTVHLHSLLLLL